MGIMIIIKKIVIKLLAFGFSLKNDWKADSQRPIIQFKSNSMMEVRDEKVDEIFDYFSGHSFGDKLFVFTARQGHESE